MSLSRKELMSISKPMLLKKCRLVLLKLKVWMAQKRLKMNEAKSEIIVFGSRHQLNSLIARDLTILWIDCPLELVAIVLGP